MDMIMLIINIVERTKIISMVDVGVIKQVMKDMGSAERSVEVKDTIFMVMVATYTVNTSGEIIRTILTGSSQNKIIGRGDMNVYNDSVLPCDYISYNTCFTVMHYIIPLFR